MRALVTGGRGGIGSAIVTRLAARGYEVVAADIAPVGASGEPEIEHVQIDVAEEDGARGAVRAAAGRSGLHVLVNCHGISPKHDGLAPQLPDVTTAEWDRVFAVNVRSCFLTIREAWPVLVRHNGAAVVNIVSAVAKLAASGPPGTEFGLTHAAGVHYCASKAALANLTASAARALAVHGIRCNGVAPGYIGSGGMGGTTDSAVEARLVRQLPLGRPGTGDEVAGVVEFLVSPQASYLTGEIIDVDGGWNPD